MPTYLKPGTPAEPNTTQHRIIDSGDLKDESNNSLVPSKVDPGYRGGNKKSGDKKSVRGLKTKRKLSPGKMVSLGLIVISIFILGAGAYFGYNVLAVSGNVLGQGSDVGFWGQLGRLAGNLTNQRQPIAGEQEGRTNVLLMGRDAIGAGLTDTIILGSYYHEQDKFVTLNIPRDFYVTDGFGSYKINSVYAFAEQRNPGSGEQYLADFLGEEFGIPIHYWASINFNGLSLMVDELGGIEVDVPNGFTDCQYPDARMQGYIRPCPTFEQGVQTMDGTTALIYARSRKGSNGEGSDFARSKRQSIVIEAIAQKAKNSNIAVNASKINSYLDILGGSLRTNARIDELVSGAGLEEQFEPSSGFLRIVWDTSNGILCDNSSSDGAYIITYCDGTIAGRQSNSRVREQARYVVGNMLQQAELSEVFDADVRLYGNLSNDTDQAYNALETIGFTNITFNNNYNQIAPATFNSIEKTYVYIQDESLRNLFGSIDPQPDFEYELRETVPEDKIIPSSAQNADIIIWVESVN